MKMDDLRKKFTTSYRILGAERDMRASVFRGDPQKRAAKCAEMDEVMRTLTEFKDLIKGQLERENQPSLFDTPHEEGDPQG